MDRPLIPDDLWEIVAPLLPPEPVSPGAGRPRLSHREVLTGIICVLKSGIPWNHLPPEFACGSGMTCYRRWREWQAAGYWPRVQRALTPHLASADAPDWLRPALERTKAPAAAKRLRLVRRIDAIRNGTPTL
jgi:transposase